MRPFRCLTPVALAALSGLATGACGLADVFRPVGLNGVVVSYLGATDLTVGARIAPDVSVEADGVPVPNPRLRFTSSDPTVLALTPMGDTLVACGVGQALLTIGLVSSVVTDTVPSTQASIRVTGGAPLPTCP